MYATQFVSDAAVFAPQPPRHSLQPIDEKPAERRKTGVLANLRGRLASHAPGHHPAPSRG